MYFQGVAQTSTTLDVPLADITQIFSKVGSQAPSHTSEVSSTGNSILQYFYCTIIVLTFVDQEFHF
jgi:hypothetical protein